MTDIIAAAALVLQHTKIELVPSVHRVSWFVFGRTAYYHRKEYPITVQEFLEGFYKPDGTPENQYVSAVGLSKRMLHYALRELINKGYHRNRL